MHRDKKKKTGKGPYRKEEIEEVEGPSIRDIGASDLSASQLGLRTRSSDEISLEPFDEKKFMLRKRLQFYSLYDA
jgi:hypothetical protein